MEFELKEINYQEGVSTHLQDLADTKNLKDRFFKEDLVPTGEELNKAKIELIWAKGGDDEAEKTAKAKVQELKGKYTQKEKIMEALKERLHILKKIIDGEK